jgi:hypothetical protein
MNISRLASGFVLGLAAFMICEWLMLAKNLGSGPPRPTAFYVVHGILVGLNIGLAIVLGAIGWRAWSSSRRD